MLLAVILLTETKEYFFLAAFGATIFVNSFMAWVYPILCMRCENKYIELPNEQSLLKRQI